MNREQIVKILVHNKTRRELTNPSIKAVFTVDPWKAADEIIKLQKPPSIKSEFKKWCKETNRTGGVLLGRSLQEFFDWLEEKQ